MFPNFCGEMGFAGWLVMLLLWGGLLALVVWGVAQLFPDRPGPPEHAGQGRHGTPDELGDHATDDSEHPMASGS